jgi:hypothetical protein
VERGLAARERWALEEVRLGGHREELGLVRRAVLVEEVALAGLDPRAQLEERLRADLGPTAPSSMSILCANSWNTTLRRASGRPPASTSSHARITGPPRCASPWIGVPASSTGTTLGSKNPRRRKGETTVAG